MAGEGFPKKLNPVFFVMAQQKKINERVSHSSYEMMLLPGDEISTHHLDLLKANKDEKWQMQVVPRIGESMWFVSVLWLVVDVRYEKNLIYVFIIGKPEKRKRSWLFR